MRVADYIEQNMEVVETLVSVGALPISQITYFQIYRFFQSIDPSKKKMERYRIASVQFDMCVTSIRDAIKAMSQPVPVRRNSGCFAII